MGRKRGGSFSSRLRNGLRTLRTRPRKCNTLQRLAPQMFNCEHKDERVTRYDEIVKGLNPHVVDAFHKYVITGNSEDFERALGEGSGHGAITKSNKLLLANQYVNTRGGRRTRRSRRRH